MKLATLIFVAAVTLLIIPSSVMAFGTITIAGRFAGTAFANDSFDLDGDGVAARTSEVKAFDQIPFSGIEAVSDSALVSIGACAGPSSLELKPFGKFTFRGRLGDALFAEVAPTAPNLCFDPSLPVESIQITITGGTGIYATATGSGTITLNDIVRLSKLVTVPGVPFPVPAPLLIDTRGTFSLAIGF